MNIEVLSRSKYKSGNKPGDDIVLIEPDCVLAVFDGATDPTGAFYDGESSGRIAARHAARCASDLARSGALVSSNYGQIFQALSDSVKAAALERGIAHPPSTTAAMVVDAGASYRLLALGDTGIRINGTTIYQHHKIIDTVSTTARIAVHAALSKKIMDPDEAEMTTRKVIFDGLDAAVSSGRLSDAEAAIAINAAVEASALSEDIVAGFLKGGIRTQFHHANGDDPLGFASINGRTINLDGITDITLPKAEVKSIEIFSDGYVSLPSTGVNVSHWEEEFDRVERADFHKTGPFQAVKGGTTFEYCDDRTVISATPARS
jgi:hypothetical protein